MYILTTKHLCENIFLLNNIINNAKADAHKHMLTEKIDGWKIPWKQQKFAEFREQ